MLYVSINKGQRKGGGEGKENTKHPLTSQIMWTSLKVKSFGKIDTQCIYVLTPLSPFPHLSIEKESELGKVTKKAKGSYKEKRKLENEKKEKKKKSKKETKRTFVKRKER